MADAVFSPNVGDIHIWNLIFVLFQLHRNSGVKGGYQIFSWDEIQFTFEDLTFFCVQLSCYWAKHIFFYYSLVAMVKIETVGFKPRWSLILEMNFPLPVWAVCIKS